LKERGIQGVRLKVGKRLWLATSLLVIGVLLGGGCTGHSKVIEPLTDNEKDRLIEIALNTPKASAWLEKESIYKVDVRWIAITWGNSRAVGWSVLDYEEVADGKPPPYISESAIIYPSFLVRFGEPEHTLVVVAIDRDTEEVVLVQECPAAGPVLPKKIPPPGPPEGAN